MGKHSLESPPQPVIVVGLTVIGAASLSLRPPHDTCAMCYTYCVLHVLIHSMSTCRKNVASEFPATWLLRNMALMVSMHRLNRV